MMQKMVGINDVESTNYDNEPGEDDDNDDDDDNDTDVYNKSLIPG